LELCCVLVYVFRNVMPYGLVGAYHHSGWTFYRERRREHFRGSNPTMGKKFCSLKGPDRLWCLASCSTGIEVISRKWSGRGVIWTTHLPLGPGLRMSGAIPLLPLYAFMAGTGTLLFLLLVHIYQATRRHNLIVHSSTRSWTPYLQIEISGLNSPHKKCYFLRVGSGCSDVMGCWSLSLSLIPRCYTAAGPCPLNGSGSVPGTR
jgi:hypothetical protein